MQSRTQRERDREKCRAEEREERENAEQKCKAEESEGEGGRMGERERDILPLYHLYLGIDTPVGRT